MTKGEKYYLISDSQGFFYTFKRDGSFRSVFYSGFNKITSLVKHYVNVMFTSGNKIGFVKLSENTIGSIICDAGPYQLLSVTLD